jgi:hypothetical protein
MELSILHILKSSYFAGHTMDRQRITQTNPESLSNISQKYRIVEHEGGILILSQLELVLDLFPMAYKFVKEDTCPRQNEFFLEDNVMEVYHSTSVISLFPEKGYRLAFAAVTDPCYSIRPDLIMDDSLGLRCCFHPKLSSFGVSVPGIDMGSCSDQIEFDIHKFPKESKYRRYETLTVEKP